MNHDPGTPHVGRLFIDPGSTLPKQNNVGGAGLSPKKIAHILMVWNSVRFPLVYEDFSKQKIGHGAVGSRL